MSKPSKVDVLPLPHLLEDWATQFTSSPDIRRRLVELTTSKAIDAVPDLIDDDEIERRMLAIMRSIALDEFGLQGEVYRHEGGDGHGYRNHSRGHAHSS